MVPVPAEDPKWCYVPLHGQLNGACLGSALQNQKQTQTLVQVGNARWGRFASRLQDVIAGNASSYSCFDLLTVNTTVWVKQPVAQLGLG